MPSLRLFVHALAAIGMQSISYTQAATCAQLHSDSFDLGSDS